MSIEKKPNGTYQVRWRDPAGKQRARSFARKVDATNFEATVTVDTLHGTYVDPHAGRETVGAYATRWADAQPWRQQTRDRMLHVVDKQINPRWKSTALRAVRPSDVQAWVGEMTAKGLAPSTVES